MSSLMKTPNMYPIDDRIYTAKDKIHILHATRYNREAKKHL